MSNPPIIYKKFHKYRPIDEFKGIQWFALTGDYGTMYGDVTKSYRFKQNPKLLNIGDADVRVMIENEIEKYDTTMLKYFEEPKNDEGEIIKFNKIYDFKDENIFNFKFS